MVMSVKDSLDPVRSSKSLPPHPPGDVASIVSSNIKSCIDKILELTRRRIYEEGDFAGAERLLQFLRHTSGCFTQLVRDQAFVASGYYSECMRSTGRRKEAVERCRESLKLATAISDGGERATLRVVQWQTSLGCALMHNSEYDEAISMHMQAMEYYLTHTDYCDESLVRDLCVDVV